MGWSGFRRLGLAGKLHWRLGECQSLPATRLWIARGYGLVDDVSIAESARDREPNMANFPFADHTVAPPLIGI